MAPMDTAASAPLVIPINLSMCTAPFQPHLVWFVKDGKTEIFSDVVTTCGSDFGIR